MREIKFRVWDKEDKRIITHEQEFTPLKVTNIGVFKLDPCLKENRWILINKDRFEFMEYTGLNYRVNNKEIYECDIIKALNRNYDNEDNWRDYFQTFEVTYLNGCWMFGNYNAHEFFNKYMYIEVIGNKFEGIKED